MMLFFMTFGAFVAILLISRIAISAGDKVLRSGDDSGIAGQNSAGVNQELVEALREQFESCGLRAEESPCKARPGKLCLTIRFDPDASPSRSEMIHANLRCILRWFNQRGVGCGEIRVCPGLHPIADETFRRAFEERVMAHPRVVEMERRGCPIILG